MFSRKLVVNFFTQGLRCFYVYIDIIFLNCSRGYRYRLGSVEIRNGIKTTIKSNHSLFIFQYNSSLISNSCDKGISRVNHQAFVLVKFVPTKTLSYLF